MAGPIVVGCDGSECSGGALDVAVRLARELETHLVITYAYEPPVRSAGEEFDVHRDALAELGQQVAGPARDRALAAGIDAEIALVSERPVPALLSTAQKHDARMIVVGTYGESPLRGAIVGSVPHKLLQVADRPVVVVPYGSARQVVPSGG